MSGNKDRQIDRYAEIRNHKCSTRDEELLVDSHFNVVDAATIEAAHLLALGLLYAEFPLAGTGAAADAATTNSINTNGEAVLVVGGTTAGETAALTTFPLIQQDRRPELDLTYNIASAALAAERHEIGMFRAPGAATTMAQTGTEYAVVSYDTQASEAADWVLRVAASDFKVLTLDASGGAGSEFVDDASTVAKNDTADDFGIDKDLPPAGNAETGDGLIIFSPRPIQALIFTTSTVEGAAHTEHVEYWSGSAFVAVDGSLTNEFAGDALGRQRIEFTDAQVAAQGIIANGDAIVGVLDDADLANTALQTDDSNANIIGWYCVRLRIDTAGAGAGPLFRHLAVEGAPTILSQGGGEVAALGTNIRVRMRLSEGSRPAIQAQLNDEGWQTAPAGVGLSAASARDWFAGIRLQTFDDNAAQGEIDHMKAWQFAQHVALTAM